MRVYKCGAVTIETCIDAADRRNESIIEMAAILATDISANGNKMHLIRSKSDTAINESNTRTVTRTTSVKSLEKSLLLKKDLVLDFTSLKSCLDPLSETGAGKDTENGSEQVSIAC